jgi:hypothetical protein
MSVSTCTCLLLLCIQQHHLMWPVSSLAVPVRQCYCCQQYVALIAVHASNDLDCLTCCNGVCNGVCSSFIILRGTGWELQLPLYMFLLRHLDRSPLSFLLKNVNITQACASDVARLSGIVSAVPCYCFAITTFC